MITITSRSSGADIVKELRDAPGRAKQVAGRALPGAIRTARTVMVREIARDTGLTSGDVEKALTLYEEAYSATLGASVKRIPLIDFHAQGPVPSRGKGGGVTYQLKGGRLIPNAFIAEVDGRRGVFKRKGTGRVPLQELFGPSIAQVFEKYISLAAAKGEESFSKNFEHEFSRAGGTEVAADVSDTAAE